MSRFYHKEESEFAPHYGDIDFRAMLAAKLALTGEGISAEPVWFDSEDGLDQECSQATTDIYVNKASDDMDAVLVLDPRDNMRFSFFRSDLGGETFDTISKALQEVGAAAVHWTLYPQQEIAEMWVRQNTDDDISGYVPDDWMKP